MKDNSVLQKMLDAKVILAPMAGVTDVPFRLHARRYGCRFAFTEMIDVNGIFYNNRKTLGMLDTLEEDSPLAVQIAGSDEDKILHAATRCEEKGFRLLDLNAGCPAPKVIKGDKGAALLKDPEKLARIIRTLVKRLSIPVTVKIRSGWSEEDLNYLEVSDIAGSEGASAICIHPRTRGQMYKGSADHAITREIKKKAGIPVFASGNIFTPEDAESVLRTTGCDGVFLARGALGNPWLFRRAEEHLSGKEISHNITFSDVKKAVKEHMALTLKFYTPSRSFSRMYKHVCWYLKRYKNLNEVMMAYGKVKDEKAFSVFLDRLTLADGRILHFA